MIRPWRLRRRRHVYLAGRCGLTVRRSLSYQEGRGGKGITTVFNLHLDDDGVRDLAAVLKQRCGTGGTVKDGRIEIQGDQRERVVAELERLGYRVKRVGG
jgi:predicted translation initiation factor SUI1